MSSGGAAEEEVVLRKHPRIGEQATSKILEHLKEGDKRVKWSESTDLREKMKEYRRSQLSMTLDYHHLTAEEEREKAGVRQWRDSLQKCQLQQLESESQTDDGITTNADDNEAEEDCDDCGDDSSGIESDEFTPAGDEDLELKLRVIKATTTKHTLLPAYRAAVDVYKPWLDDNSSSLAENQLKTFQSQCDLYSQVLSLYDQWSASDSLDQVDTRFDQISRLLQQAKTLGEPPPPVADAITKVLTSPENTKKQSELYDQMVNDMVTTFSESIHV